MFHPRSRSSTFDTTTGGRYARDRAVMDALDASSAAARIDAAASSTYRFIGVNVATARPVARPLLGRAEVLARRCSYMAVRPRPWRRSALVGRALPGLALPGRRRESPAEVGFDGFVFDAFVFVAEDRAEAGMVDPNAESRAAPRDGTDPFASVKGTGARFPSAVCLLMPEGSNDLTACAADAVPNRESEKTEGFEPLTGNGDREGLSTSGAPRGTAVGLTCVAVLREGPAVVARPLMRAGYSPDNPRASSNENLNSLCRCASALAPP